MKRRNKGTVGFIIETVLYGLLSIIIIISAIGMAVEAESAYRGQQEFYAIGLLGAIALFITLSIWYISFSVSYQQRRTQINLLEEMNEKNLNNNPRL